MYLVGIADGRRIVGARLVAEPQCLRGGAGGNGRHAEGGTSGSRRHRAVPRSAEIPCPANRDGVVVAGLATHPHRDALIPRCGVADGGVVVRILRIHHHIAAANRHRIVAGRPLGTPNGHRLTPGGLHIHTGGHRQLAGGDRVHSHCDCSKSGGTGQIAKRDTAKTQRHGHFFRVDHAVSIQVKAVTDGDGQRPAGIDAIADGDGCGRAGGGIGIGGGAANRADLSALIGGWCTGDGRAVRVAAGIVCRPTSRRCSQCQQQGQ